MKAKRETSELEMILKYFLPPGLRIDPITRKAVESSAYIAATADFRHHRQAKPPNHPHAVYDFLGKSMYFRTITNLRGAVGGS